MYTIRDIPKEEPIGIPDVDILCNDLPENHNWPHENYFWSPEWVYEFGAAVGIHVFAFPIGSLANYHTFLKNASPNEVNFNNANVTRLNSPGAGAFTDLSRIYVASRDIK